MLTRAQIAAIARKEGLPLHTIERDYLQHLILRHVTKGKFVFKGGTCLRIAFGSPRYSEDLDFNSDMDKDEVESHIHETVRRLGDYGITAELIKEQTIGDSFNARLRYEGPLFDGNPLSRGTVWIEVSLRREEVESEEIFRPRTPYPDVPQLVLVTLAENHLLAEKVRALIVRKKARDLFDVHFLIIAGTECSRSLIDKKMRIYDRMFSMKALDTAIKEVETTWIRDLGSLLGDAPPYEQVAREVRSDFHEWFSRKK